jgi:hypothetical protein
MVTINHDLKRHNRLTRLIRVKLNIIKFEKLLDAKNKKNIKKELKILPT